MGQQRQREQRFHEPKAEYTSEELRALACVNGYNFLKKPDLFRQWVRLGIFPPARRLISPPGERRRFGVWGADDARWLLDACRLHALDTNTTRIRLGLWLLGYPVSEGEQLARDQLAALLLEIRERLTGTRHAWEELSDESSDKADEHLWGIIQRSRELDLLGLATPSTLRDDELESIQDMHPQLGRGPTRRQLDETPYPEATGETTRIPTSDTDEERDLANTLRIPESLDVPIYRYPRTNAHPTSGERQTDEQRRAFMQMHVETMAYDALEWLDRALAAVAGVDDHTLRAARDSVQFCMPSYLDDDLRFAPLVGAPQIDLAALLTPYGGSLKLFFAAPKVWPLVGYLIAMHVWYAREGWQSLPRTRPFRAAVIVERLSRRQKSRPPDDDTVLLTLLSLYGPSEDTALVIKRS